MSGNDCEDHQVFRRNGGARRDRTDDLMLAKHALSQLSYGPIGLPLVSKQTLVGPGRFELPTPRLSSVCSNQLSYGPSPAALCRYWARNPSLLPCISFNKRRQAARGSRKRNEDGGEPPLVFCRDVRPGSEDQAWIVRLLGSSRSPVRLDTLEHP
jgi:hypothetical protein